MPPPATKGSKPQKQIDWHTVATSVGILPGMAPAVLEDIPEQLAKERALRDNGAWGEYVDQDLAELLVELDQIGSDLSLLGFDDDQLKALLDQVGIESGGTGTEDPGATEPPVDPITKPGDMWAMGDHRLYCGDSTDPESIQRLFGDARATLCVTSPPYWVGREYEQEHGEDQIKQHIAEAAQSIASAMSDRSHIAINTGTTAETRQGGTVRRTWLLLDWWAAELLKYGWNLRNIRIWAKEGGFSGFAPTQDLVGQDWEFLASFTHDKPLAQNRIDGAPGWCLAGVWDCQPQTANVGHSAPYPPEIPSRFIQLYTQPGDIVFEPYCGSGTTIVAAEQLDRIVYGCELDASYCDVSLKRWSEMTGQQPYLIGNGQSLDELGDASIA